MGIFDFEWLFDLNRDGTLDPLEKGLEFTVIEDIMNDDEDNDDLFSSDSDDEFDTDFGDDFWFYSANNLIFKQKARWIFRLNSSRLYFYLSWFCSSVTACNCP